MKHRRVFFDWRYVKGERRRAYRLAFLLFWSVLLYFVFARYVIGLGIVTDISMLPTLRAGDYFLINQYAYQLHPPARGDIVVLRRSQFDSDQYVKRVIGLPGETLRLAGGRVFLNGRRLEEPYAMGWTGPALGPIHLAPQTYFVLGDNREQSEDSRQFGAIPRAGIEGKIKPGEWFPWW